MDVESAEEIGALAMKLEGVAIDVLINNAGIYSDRSVCTDDACRGAGDTQSFGQTDYALFDQIMAVNVRGPLLVSEAFIDNVRAGEQKKIVSISSTNGSVTFTLGGSGAIAYRASKAALNREMQLVAVHLKNEGITVLLLHPGAVLTERQADLKFPGMIEMQPSVAGMIEQIAKATIADTGRFIQYDGATAPW
jgi:NAD(P)-dependent dehydrogenase (short-subunit alcohol dehydrogenase family)